MTELFAAFIGAVAAGLFGTIERIRERQRNSEAALTAIATEVDSLCELIRYQRYLEAFEQLVADINTGKWDGRVWVIDIRANYFSVYEALAGELGHLQPKHLEKIVRFYAHCRSAIDSTRPDGPAASSEDLDLKSIAIRGMAMQLKLILELGDEIVAFPKQPITRAVATSEVKRAEGAK